MLRLSCIIQSFHNAFEIIKPLDVKLRFDISIELDQYLDEFFKENKKMEVNLENTERAYKLVQYFNLNKLVLAGYNIDLTKLV